MFTERSSFQHSSAAVVNVYMKNYTFFLSLLLGKVDA